MAKQGQKQKDMVLKFLCVHKRQILCEILLFFSHVVSNVLKGVSATSKAVGKFIGSISKIKDGSLDERLQEAGEHVGDKAKAIEEDSIVGFAEMSNPGTSLFTEKMDDMITIYNHTTDICFDNNNIYLIAN